MLNRDRGHAIRKIYRLAWVAISMKMGQESGGKYITCPGGVHFIGGIGGKFFYVSMLEEGCAVAPLRGNQQRDLPAPTGEDCVRIRPIVLCRMEQDANGGNEGNQQKEDFSR